METEKANVLYVDDEMHLLNAFEAAFKNYYNVFVAQSALEAINILRKQPIAVVIADQRMPDMTGIQFFEAILPEYPDSIRILMSGYSDADIIIRAINEGQVFRYISKPWDENELKLSVDVAIKIYRLSRENRDKINKMHEESIKRERILNLFRKYVPNHVVDQSLSTSSENLFSGELRNVTILFSSIDNLTKNTEKTDPQKTLKYLNTYFSLMSSIIENHKGTVDKFIGGQILAIFGAPMSSIHSENNAVFCALAMMNSLKEFNETNAALIGHETSISAAIHSGECVTGNIGSQQYISYTVIGDVMNTTARILELAEEKQNTLFITEPVYNAVKDDFLITPLGTKEIRGKKNSVSIFQVSGTKFK